MNGWIKVSDRIPGDDDGDEFWVFNGSYVGWSELLGGRFYTPQAAYLKGITHWQPVIAPEPPVE